MQPAMAENGIGHSAPAHAGAQRPSAGLLGLLTGVLAASFLLPMPAADGRVAHIPSICPFYELTGLPCPGCGLTRAFICIGHGHWAQSLHWHPIGWLVYGVFVFLWLQTGMALLTGRPALVVPQALQRRLGWGFLAMFLFVGVGRIGWLVAHHTRFG